MPIDLKGKTYRNMQEQVLKNAEDIIDLRKRIPYEDEFYTKDETDEKFATIEDLSDYYDKDEVDDKSEKYFATIKIDRTGALKGTFEFSIPIIKSDKDIVVNLTYTQLRNLLINTIQNYGSQYNTEVKIFNSLCSGGTEKTVNDTTSFYTAYNVELTQNRYFPTLISVDFQIVGTTGISLEDLESENATLNCRVFKI